CGVSFPGVIVSVDEVTLTQSAGTAFSVNEPYLEKSKICSVCVCVCVCVCVSRLSCRRENSLVCWVLNTVFVFAVFAPRHSLLPLASPPAPGGVCECVCSTAVSLLTCF